MVVGTNFLQTWGSTHEENLISRWTDLVGVAPSMDASLGVYTVPEVYKMVMQDLPRPTGRVYLACYNLVYGTRYQAREFCT